MVTTNALQRTLFIRQGDSIGTAFTVDRGGRQYIVTARHVAASGGAVEIRHDQQWKLAEVDLVAVGDGQLDVTVLDPGRPLTPDHPLEPCGGGLTLGQQVAFLGFPFGWDAGGADLNNGFPLPFLKAGVVSGILFRSASQDAVSRIYVDAHGNPGFSGGPLVFNEPGKPNEHKVAGVISDSPLDPISKDHAGFVRAISIRHVVEMIDAHQRG